MEVMTLTFQGHVTSSVTWPIDSLYTITVRTVVQHCINGDTSFLWGFFIFFLQSTWRSDPSTDFNAKWLKRRGFAQGGAFCSKNRNFFKPLTPKSQKPRKFGPFSDLENF